MMEPTNSLVICSDQHNKFITGCYGSEFVQTPNLDRLAQLGTRFNSAYTPSPICMPARAALATGRYCHEIGAWGNGSPYTGTHADTGAAIPTWGHRLTEQGFDAVTVGKLHFHPDVESGYDERIPLHATLAKDGYGPAIWGWMRGDMPPSEKLRKEVESAHVGEFGYTRYDRQIAQTAASWIEDEVSRDKPWSAFISFTYPHYPFVVPQSYVDLYDPDSLPLPPNWQEEDWSPHPALRWKMNIHAFDRGFTEAQLRKVIAIYYGMVTFMDEQVGIVLDALERSGQWDNTRILYTSDHGEMLGEQGFFFKGLMHESSAGIPMIMAGPDVPEAHICHTPVNLIDVYPTVIETVGAALTEEDSTLHGRSLIDIANEPDDKERVTLSEYHSVASQSGTYMVRCGYYKYVHYLGQDAQLFDLSADPHEANNLAGGAPMQELREDYEAKLRAILDPEAVDAQARAFQQAELAKFGDLAQMKKFEGNRPYSAPPEQFGQ
ncbi:MAG: sulfatase-like hydrolase/transferase [Chloroflexota bacterium]